MSAEDETGDAEIRALLKRLAPWPLSDETEPRTPLRFVLPADALA